MNLEDKKKRKQSNLTTAFTSDLCSHGQKTTNDSFWRNN